MARKPYINWAVKRVTRSLQVLWPRSRTNIFGSVANGLSLPTSDVDLVVSLPPVRNLVKNFSYLFSSTCIGKQLICWHISRNPLKKLGYWRVEMVLKRHAFRYVGNAIRHCCSGRQLSIAVHLIYFVYWLRYVYRDCLGVSMNEWSCFVHWLVNVSKE